MDKLTKKIQANQTTQTVIARVGFTGYDESKKTEDGESKSLAILNIADLLTRIIAYNENAQDLQENSIIKANLTDIEHLEDKTWQATMESVEILCSVQ